MLVPVFFLFFQIGMFSVYFYCTQKKFSSFKQIEFVDEKLSHFNKMSFVTTKPIRNQQNFTFL